MSKLPTNNILRHWGQLYVVGIYGTSFNHEIENLIETYKPGGHILFKRNLAPNREGIKKLIQDIYDKYDSLNLPKPLICIDHEGGRVHRFDSLATRFPPPGLTDSLTDEELFNIYRQQALELKYFGINCILGPVLDLCPGTGTKSHINVRSFGMDVDFVIHRSQIAIHAFKKEGLITVPKHFPGYGEAELDPHLHLPSNNLELSALRETYLQPFERAVAKGIECLMTAHILNKKVDSEFPATLSNKWLSLLRNELKFNGAIMSDDLCMRSIWDKFPVEKYTELGLKAGMNIFLICYTKDDFQGSFDRSYQHLLQLAKSNYELCKKIDQSLDRIEHLKLQIQGFKPHNNEAVFTHNLHYPFAL